MLTPMNTNIALAYWGQSVFGQPAAPIMTPIAVGGFTLMTQAEYEGATWSISNTIPQPAWADLQSIMDAAWAWWIPIQAANAYANFSASLATAIPTAVSQLANDAGYLTSSALTTAVSAFSLSTSGSGATGTQVSATKRATVHINVSESVTSNIGGAAVGAVAFKTCATNSATESDWATICTIEEDQTITLALALQSVQVIKDQVTIELPAGYYIKAEASGSGTNSEALIAGQKIIYG